MNIYPVNIVISEKFKNPSPWTLAVRGHEGLIQPPSRHPEASYSEAVRVSSLFFLFYKILKRWDSHAEKHRSE